MIADFQFIGVTHNSNFQFALYIFGNIRKADCHNGQVMVRIRTFYLCFYDGIIGVFRIHGKADAQFFCSVHHMVVGSDQKLFICLGNDHTGTGTFCFLILCCSEKHALYFFYAFVCDCYDGWHRILCDLRNIAGC